MNGQATTPTTNSKKSVCFEVPSILDAIKILTLVITAIVAVSLFVARSNTLPHDMDMLKVRVDKIEEQKIEPARIEKLERDLPSIREDIAAMRTKVDMSYDLLRSIKKNN